MTSVIQRFAVFSAVVALCVALAAPAQANHTGSYFSIEGTVLSLDDNSSGQSSDSTPTGVRIKFGTRISRYFDVEGQFGGASENSNSGRGFQSSSRFDSVGAVFGGVYIKGHIPIGFGTTLFGLGGIGSVGIAEGFDNREFDDLFTGFSFGGGIETQISDRIDLTADFISYGQEEGDFDNIISLNFGVKLYF